MGEGIQWKIVESTLKGEGDQKKDAPRSPAVKGRKNKP